MERLLEDVPIVKFGGKSITQLQLKLLDSCTNNQIYTYINNYTNERLISTNSLLLNLYLRFARGD